MTTTTRSAATATASRAYDFEPASSTRVPTAHHDVPSCEPATTPGDVVSRVAPSVGEGPRLGVAWTGPVTAGVPAGEGEPDDWPVGDPDGGTLEAPSQPT